MSTPLTSRVMGMVGALLCVSLLWVGPGVAHAQEPGVELAPTMVVLDASGSMTGVDPTGGTKMDAAKRAVQCVRWLTVSPPGGGVWAGCVGARF